MVKLGTNRLINKKKLEDNLAPPLSGIYQISLAGFGKIISKNEVEVEDRKRCPYSDGK